MENKFETTIKRNVLVLLKLNDADSKRHIYLANSLIITGIPNRGRTASYPTAPHRSGITAPGSSELLTSHIATRVFLDIMIDPWFD